MIETTEFSLPGGYLLPFSLETETLREYTIAPTELSSDAAEALLNAEALRLIPAHMTAGRVEEGRTAVQHREDCYHCHAAFHCVELISRTVPAELFREETENGKIDQRGAD